MSDKPAPDAGRQTFSLVRRERPCSRGDAGVKKSTVCEPSFATGCKFAPRRHLDIDAHPVTDTVIVNVNYLAWDVRLYHPVPPDTHAEEMSSGAMVRVVCVDGPCHGLHYVEIKTGRILDEDPDDLGLWYIYRVSDNEITHTDFGRSRSAHFRYVKPADKPAEQPDLSDGD